MNEYENEVNSYWRNILKDTSILCKQKKAWYYNAVFGSHEFLFDLFIYWFIFLSIYWAVIESQALC